MRTILATLAASLLAGGSLLLALASLTGHREPEPADPLMLTGGFFAVLTGTWVLTVLAVT